MIFCYYEYNHLQVSSEVIFSVKIKSMNMLYLVSICLAATSRNVFEFFFGQFEVGLYKAN